MVEQEEDMEIVYKQKLLEKEIIEKNYDKGAFYDYCINSKPDGDNIANYTLKEITELIQGFTEQQEQIIKTQEEKDKFYQEVEAKFEELQINMEQMKEKMFSYSEIAPPELAKINCKKQEVTPLNSINAIATIETPKIIVTNFFSSNYVNYDVKTSPLDWCVTRRYSDFEWLRCVMKKYFPRFCIPPLPNKKIGSRRFEASFVEKRMKYLQCFIDHLMSVELFKASQPLKVFLSETDRPSFETKIKEFNAYTPPVYVEDLKNIPGFIWTSHDNEQYFDNITNYFNLDELLLERLNYNLKHFHLSINAVCKSIDEIQKDFETLHILNSRVSMKEEITKSFSELGSFFKNWKLILLNQSSIVKNDLKDFFKYIQMESVSFKDIIQNRLEIKAKYTQENDRLNYKKEKLWSALDITKWDINEDLTKLNQASLLNDKQYAFKHMCTQDTTSLQNTYNQLGYCNQNTKDELKRIVARYCKLYVDNIKKFANNFSPTVNFTLQNWTNLIAAVDSY